MKARAAVLAEFNRPLELREYDLTPLAPGEVLVRVAAAGICGSDVHIWRGQDPRTKLPLILGHEGIGRVAGLTGAALDVLGRPVAEGDLVMWERGVMCGRCVYCLIKKRPALCPARRTYGISVSCAEPPYLRGAYADHIRLLPGAHLIKIEGALDPAVLVPASCSGATAASAVEQAGLRPGDTVAILGPGPLGIFVLALCREGGAGRIIVFGTAADAERLKWCREFGADETMMVDQTTLEERQAAVRKLSGLPGAEVVVECTGSRRAAEEALEYAAPGGTVSIPGIATPVGESKVKLFEQIARQNVRLQGVWVSDTSHLLRAIQLILSGRYPFARFITHRFPLEKATAALETVERREAMKAVLVP